jgi:hypothetical protein
VPEVDHLTAGGLEHAPYDVDADIVAVEKRGRRDKAEFILRDVDLFFHGVSEFAWRPEWRPLPVTAWQAERKRLLFQVKIDEVH